ncbi:DUF6230 family protein [Plantactinospora siamensis]|uniref:DUF6230 family protein n=1 Tax=Plantactinospora siamensis TaxID=555372 RepID=A0ABV6P2N9_9ACTN
MIAILFDRCFKLLTDVVPSGNFQRIGVARKRRRNHKDRIGRRPFRTTPPILAVKVIKGGLMSSADVSGSRAPGKVRWRRFAGMLLTAGVAGGALAMLTAQGVLAAQFSVSGMPFTVTADKLSGTGFEQFATLDHMIENSPNEGDTGGQLVLIVSAIDRAELTNLCQSVSLGGMNLKITAGDNGKAVTAHTLVVDSDSITGNASFDDIDIGQDASTLDRVPGVKGNPGVFAQQARTVTILDLRQNNYATTAAAFSLPHLRMSFTDSGC